MVDSPCSRKIVFCINGALKSGERVMCSENRWHGNIVSHYFEVEFCRRDCLNGKTGGGKDVLKGRLGTERNMESMWGEPGRGGWRKESAESQDCGKYWCGSCNNRDWLSMAAPFWFHLLWLMGLIHSLEFLISRHGAGSRWGVTWGLLLCAVGEERKKTKSPWLRTVQEA